MELPITNAKLFELFSLKIYVFMTVQILGDDKTITIVSDSRENALKSLQEEDAYMYESITIDMLEEFELEKGLVIG